MGYPVTHNARRITRFNDLMKINWCEHVQKAHEHNDYDGTSSAESTDRATLADERKSISCMATRLTVFTQYGQTMDVSQHNWPTIYVNEMANKI